MERGKALSLMERGDLHSGTNARLRRLATYASIAVALTLIAIKLAAYFMTDSVAMLSSLLDSTIDLIASLVTAYGVASALRPPDHDHRFGHGKAEPLAALAQSAFIVGSSVLLGYEALSRLYQPHEIQNEMIGYAVMSISIIMTMLLVAFQHHVIHKTRSLAIRADSLHYVGDLVVNAAVIAAFALHQWTGVRWFDPAFALAIAAGLVATAFRISIRALEVLMDAELPDTERSHIQTLVRGHNAVRGIHDMRTRSDSDRIFMELHVEMDPEMTLREAHVVGKEIEAAIRSEFPNADILLHQDPAGVIERRLDEEIAAVAPNAKA